MSDMFKPIGPSELSMLRGPVPLQGSMGGAKVAGTPNFTEVFSSVMEEVSKAQARSAQMGLGLQMNDPRVSVEDVAVASNEASLKFQAVLQARNKLLQAYSEIMSMPV